MKVKLLTGDCLEKMKKIPDNYVDSIVTDPPAGISFMSKEWDNDKGGRNQWINWLKDIMIEAKRTLKPGGHMFVWALPRTSHWTATAIEDAGFEIRDVVVHVFGSGFPKSHNIGKSIDKILGNERIELGENPNHRTSSGLLELGFQDGRPSSTITKGSSDWEGWGTGLKPASEHWILCRKPLSEKTIANNVLKWGTGGINIDKSRIPTDDKLQVLHKLHNDTDEKDLMGNMKGKNTTGRHIEFVNAEQGRFPANFITTISEDQYIIRDDISDDERKKLISWLYENL